MAKTGEPPNVNKEDAEAIALAAAKALQVPDPQRTPYNLALAADALIKALADNRVDTLRIDRRGVHADRLWAVRDVEKGVTASARRIPVLLQCSARYAAGSGAGAW